MISSLIFGTLIVFISSAILIYLAAVYHNDYWKRRGVTGPRPVPFAGNMNEWFGKKPMVHVLREWSKKYGKVFGIQEGFANILVVSDVAMLHELFVKKFKYFHGRKLAAIEGDVDKVPEGHVFNARGERWQRLRAVSNPVFSETGLKKVFPLMHDSARVMLEYFDEKFGAGKSFNIYPHFQEFTLDAMTRVAMGQRESHQFRNVEYVNRLKNMCERYGTTWMSYLSSMTFPGMEMWVHRAAKLVSRFTDDPFMKTVREVEAEVRLRKVLREAGEHKPTEGADDESDNGGRSSKSAVDFIDMFLDVECSEADANTFDKTASKISKRLSENEIVSQCIVFLLAGFDATASSLAVTCHFLAANQSVQDRLREEILNVCPEGEPSYEQINQLQYADVVMKETLRLVPIAAFACARSCSQTTTLGEYTVEAGTIVQADILTVHHDKEIWGDDAEEFRPERWLNEKVGTVKAADLGWMPFGEGPRRCIGEGLAYLQQKLALVNILRKYALVRTAESEGTLTMIGVSMLKPERVTVSLQMVD